MHVSAAKLPRHTWHWLQMSMRFYNVMLYVSSWYLGTIQLCGLALLAERQCGTGLGCCSRCNEAHHDVR